MLVSSLNFHKDRDKLYIPILGDAVRLGVGPRVGWDFFGDFFSAYTAKPRIRASALHGVRHVPAYCPAFARTHCAYPGRDGRL